MYSERELRRNLALGIISGVFFRLYYTLADPALVLTWFVSGCRTRRLRSCFRCLG